VHPLRQLRIEGAARQLFQHRPQVGLGHRAACRAGPQGTHHCIEGSLAFAAQGQVQAQGHQRAFGVVAHRGIGRVFVLAVVLDPGIEAGLGHGLHGPARGLQHLVDGLGDELEISGVIDQPGAAQQQIVEVAGETFEEPQQLGVVLPAVVVRGELGRAQALDVPGVEVFVADQPEQRGVALAGPGLSLAGQVAAATNQGRGVAVLQPAIAVRHGIEHEHVTFERRLALGAMPETDGGLADLLGVGQQPLAVKRGGRTGHHKLVGNAAGLEAAHPERAQFYRAVHQFVVVGSAIQAKALLVGGQRLEPRGHGPLRGGSGAGHVQRVAVLFLAMHAQAQAGAVEEATRGVQPGRAHRVVVGADGVSQIQRLARRAGHLPAMLVKLGQGQRTFALARTQLLQIFRKLPHQIAARDPDGQGQLLQRCRAGDGQRDAEQVRMQVGWSDAVVNLGGLGAAWGGHGGGAEVLGISWLCQRSRCWLPPGVFPLLAYRWRQARGIHWQRSALACR